MNRIRVVVLALLLATLSATPRATTCSTALPAGHAVTPDCTYVVEQVDPGVWRDNLGQIWTFIAGVSNAVKVRLEDLHLGRWLTGR